MIYLTMDDVGMVPSKELSLIDGLRKNMPEMKITLFTVPFWNFIKPINEDREFREWFEKNKEWVEIAVHGYTHTGQIYDKPLEGRRRREEQAEMFSKSLEILKDFLPLEYGFKCPGNQYNDETTVVLKKLGFSYFAVGSTIRVLNNQPFEKGSVMTSHISVLSSFENWNFTDKFALINEGFRK